MSSSKMQTIVCVKDFSKGSPSCKLHGVLPYFEADKCPVNLFINVEEEDLVEKGVAGKQLLYDVKKYSIPRTEKNIEKLSKTGYDIDTFFKAVDIQNKLSFKWEKCYKLAENVDDTSSLSDLLYISMPFPEADKMHKEMINNPDEEGRRRAIMNKVIAQNRSKQKVDMTLCEYEETYRAIEQTGCYECSCCARRIECLLASDDRLLIWNGRVIDLEIKKAKDEVLDFLKRMVYPLMSDEEIADSKEYYANSLANEQLDCLNLLAFTDVSVITGGAGVGKTTVIKAIIESYARYHGKENIALVAPTGKASRRMKEQTGFSDCSTIHSKLRKSEEFIYYNQFNKLEANLIIVDESSMIDILLMRDLLRAVADNAKIIFVGDHNQLPPVNIGEPFFDFIKNDNVSKQALVENHRQGENNGILINANALLKDEALQAYPNFLIREIAFEEITDYAQGQSEDTVCIAPYNDICDIINDVNKKGDKAFNVGDKVIFGRNTKEYCNGDTGVCIGTDGASTIIKTDFDTVVTVKGKDFDDISLAYGITIHKSQGSEYKRVKIFLPKGDKFVSKRMIYTAVTRAKELIAIYYYDKPKTNTEKKEKVQW